MNTNYTFLEQPTDLVSTAKELNKLLKDIDPYNYMNADYSEQKVFDDLNNDPYGVIMDLITIVKDLMD